MTKELMIYNLDLDSKKVIYMPSKKYGNIMFFMYSFLIYDTNIITRLFPPNVRWNVSEMHSEMRTRLVIEKIWIRFIYFKSYLYSITQILI